MWCDIWNNRLFIFWHWLAEINGWGRKMLLLKFNICQRLMWFRCCVIIYYNYLNMFWQHTVFLFYEVNSVSFSRGNVSFSSEEKSQTVSCLAHIWSISSADVWNPTLRCEKFVRTFTSSSGLRVSQSLGFVSCHIGCYNFIISSNIVTLVWFGYIDICEVIFVLYLLFSLYLAQPTTQPSLMNFIPPF